MDKNPGAKVPMRHVYGEDDHDKIGDLFDDRDRIEKLIRMLGNNASDTEIVAAARALDRTLADSGGSHHLADVVKANWRPPAPEPPPSPPLSPKYDWQVDALRLLRYPQFLIREYPNEIDFLTNVSRMRACPSESQWRWLDDIANAITQNIPPEMRKRKWRAA